MAFMLIYTTVSLQSPHQQAKTMIYAKPPNVVKRGMLDLTNDMSGPDVIQDEGLFFI